MPPFAKYVKTLDNRKIIISKDIDSDDFDEEKALNMAEEKIIVKSNNSRGKR